MGEGSAMPTDPHHTPTFIQPSTSQPQMKQRSRRQKRKDTQVPQPSGPTAIVANEAINEEMDDSLVRADTTASSLEAEQDSGNIDKTKSKATPNEPSSPGTSSGGGPRRQETMGDTGYNCLDFRGGGFIDMMDDEDITLVMMYEMFDVGTLTGDEVLAEQVVAAKDVNLSVNEVTLAQALAALKTEFDEEVRLAREKAKKEQEANVALTEEWDDIQAKIEADHELAQRLQAQEQDELTDEENARFSKKAEAEIAHESSLKRAGEELEQESSKKQKLEEDKESKELKQCLEIILNNGDNVTIDATPLSIKSPSIVDYKIYKEGKKSYFQIIRANVKARFKKTEPVNYMDNFLLLNLKTMFEHHVEDNNMLFYLLAEKIYPLTNHTLHQMFNDVKLQVDYEYEMAFELLRLGRIVGIKSLLKVTAAKNPKTFQPKNKGLVAEIFDWDEEEVSDKEEVTQVKVLMALADGELNVGRSHARNGERVKITIRKVNTLLSMDEDADWQNYLKTTQVEKKINEKWLTSSKKVSQCISKQIPQQKKKVLGGELLTESLSKININENAFIPASMGYDQEMVPKTKDYVERLNPDSKLPNFNTRRILVPESQAVNESLESTKTLNTPESSKDSEAESLTPLPPLKNLQGASPSSMVMSLTFQPNSPKERPSLGIMKHTKPETQDSSNKSVSGTVTVSETKQTTPSVPTEVKDIEQE
ncbi:hypothetical protein Tco_1184371 [Tanacetum coccineum]